MIDYYKILNVKETASAEEIHARWIELMQKFHPDHGGGGAADEEIAKEVNEAYQVLKYSSSRMEYDFERFREKRLRKLYLRKLILPVSALTFVLFLGLLYLKKPEVRAPLHLTPQSSPSSQAERSSFPQYEPGPYGNAVQHRAKKEESVRVEKIAKVDLRQMASEMKAFSTGPRNNLEPPIQTEHPERSVGSSLISSVKEVSRPAPLESQEVVKPPEPAEKISVVHPTPPPSPPAKTEDQPVKVKPPSVVATDEEVKRFFADYAERYTEKDIRGFISLFSSKAIQNQKDGLEGIKKIYDNFFSQSQEVRYYLEETKIEIFQSAIEVKARYEIDQILRKEGEKKIWKGRIQWILVKEDGVLKIISVNYQNEKSP